MNLGQCHEESHAISPQTCAGADHGAASTDNPSPSTARGLLPVPSTGTSRTREQGSLLPGGQGFQRRCAQTAGTGQ